MTNSISLQAKVGQLVAVGIHGTALSDANIQQVIKQAEAGEIGGVIIYRYNITSKVQLTTLLQGIQQARTALPLFVYVDQEGGKIQRIDSSHGFVETLAAQQVATDLSIDEALEHYAELGRELQHTGFNFDLAPCVDIDGEPPCLAIGALQRSYGADPAQVADYGEAMLAGLGAHGVLGCLKHYPGHGRVMGDSHMGLMDITSTWQALELEPFARLIRRGVVDAVMTSHLVHQGIDADTPVTFSRIWLDKLRQDLGFEGLIVADDLHMGAIIRHYSPVQAIVAGLQAGLDQLMFSNNPLAAQPQGIRHDLDAKVKPVSTGEWQVPDIGLPPKVFTVVAAAIADGSLDEAIIDAAYQRVVALKARLVQ
jgi:beta-N-acetylhexosaminidase